MLRFAGHIYVHRRSTSRLDIKVPRLTTGVVSRNAPHTPHTAFGHLDLIRRNEATSYRSPDSAALALTNTADRDLMSDMYTDSDDTLDDDNDTPRSRTLDRRDWCAADLTGRMITPSRAGHEYVLVTAYHGYIKLVPMCNKTAKTYTKAFTETLDYYANLGHPITNLTMDNEDSTTLRTYFRLAKVSVQFVPPANHRANPAERAIRTAKNHIIALLSGIHPSMPADLWHQLLPIAELTLNHLRPGAPNPKLSAYQGLHGHSLDFAAHPLHPPGQLVVAYTPPDTRPSWGKHGLRGFYLGPALSHYRCSRVYITSTGDIRTTDTLAHFPVPLFHFSPPEPLPPERPTMSRRNPRPDGSDLIGRWFREPEFGVCEVTSTAEPYELAVGAGMITVMTAPTFCLAGTSVL